MNTKFVRFRRAFLLSIVRFRLFVARVKQSMFLVVTNYRVNQFFSLLLFGLTFLAFGYELGNGRLTVRKIIPQVTREERIQRIDEAREKRLAQKSGPDSDVTTSRGTAVPIKITVTPSVITSSSVAFGGTITTVSSSSVQVKNGGGEKQIFVINEDSVLLDKTGKKITYKELKVGETVMLLGIRKDGKVLLSRLKKT